VSGPSHPPFRLVSVKGPFDRPDAPAAPAGSPPAGASRTDQPSQLRSLLRQILFVPDPQIYWIPGAYAALRRVLSRRSADAIVCSGPPFSVFILGRALKIIWRAPLVLDYRDVWRDHPWWPVPRWRRFPEAWLERRLLSAADLVLMNHEPMLRAFLARTPRIANRYLVLPNGFDPAELGPPVSPTWRSGQKFEMVYAGTFYRAVARADGRAEPGSVERPAGLFGALRVLSERGAFGAGGVRVIFVGAKQGTGESDNLMDCARACGVVDRIEVLPRMDKSQVVPLLRRAHLLLNFVYYSEAQVAQKVYDYLHLEIPILSLLRDSEANASVVRRARGGPVVDPADTPGIASAIETILREYDAGRRPISSDRAFIDQFAVSAQVRLLDSRLRALVERRDSRPGRSDGA